MSKLKHIRELQNFTQEELSNKSGISVRTIQRIEAGTKPKGFTLRALAKALVINESELLNNETETKEIIEEKKEFFHHHIDLINEATPINFSLLKIINLSSIPFIILPPLNILIPIFLMFWLKQQNQLSKQIISLQIFWTICAPVVFFIGIFLKLGRQFTIVLIVTIILSNLFLILRNTFEIDKKQKLYYHLNFNMF